MTEMRHENNAVRLDYQLLFAVSIDTAPAFIFGHVCKATIACDSCIFVDDLMN